MKHSKYLTSLILLAGLTLVGCASNPRNNQVGPVKIDAARFNLVQTQNVEQQPFYTFKYKVNDQTVTANKNVVVSKTESWEDSFGTKVQVTY